MPEDPYYENMPTSELSRLAAALEVVANHADLNHRYWRLIHDSREQLATEQVRLTQARGMAKKLMVLAKAGGDDLRSRLGTAEENTLEGGLTQADELVRNR